MGTAARPWHRAGHPRRLGSVLHVDHGSLYPALHRLEKKGWIASDWKMTENKQRAKYYWLTAAGKKQLAVQRSRWGQLVAAIGRILDPA